MSERSRLAVLGSPIHHSKSPAIQRAAYDVLGLDWTYEAIEMTGEGLGNFVASRDETWCGLSLTMPLKRDILPLLDQRDGLVDLVGAANTVVFTDDGIWGFNTDVSGTVQSFVDAGVSSLGHVHILGAGATAASVLVAVAQLGATDVVVSARTPANAAALVDLGATLEVDVSVQAWGTGDSQGADAIVSTLPGGENGLVFPADTRQRSVLFDIAYDPWPSALASSWDEAGGTVISGLDLLVNQAVGQVRAFLSGDVGTPLPGESAVVAAMRAAVA